MRSQRLSLKSTLGESSILHLHAALATDLHKLQSRLRLVGLWIVCAVGIAALVFGQPVSAAGVTSIQQSALAQNEVHQLRLGEVTNLDLSANEQITFQLTVPESGTYYLWPSSEFGDPSVFNVAIRTGEGDILYEDVLGDVDLDLEAGSYEITFTAVEDGFTRFGVVGEVGTMSDSPREPGRLYVGSLYHASNAVRTRYATFTVPELPVPKAVVLHISPEIPELGVWLAVEGDDGVSEYLSSDDGDLLVFWSTGGEYTVSVEPQEAAASFELDIFLSAPPTELQVGDVLDDSTLMESTREIYVLTLDTFYDSVTVDLAWADEAVDLDLAVADSWIDPLIYEVSASSTNEEFVELTNLLPGSYLIIVDRYTDTEAPIDFTLSVEGVPGEPLTILESGQKIHDTLEEGDTAFFQFEVSQDGALVTLDLEADDAESDFDLAIGLSPYQSMETSVSFGPVESMTFMAPRAGTYFVQVDSFSGGGGYDLTVEETGLAPLVRINDLTSGTVGVGEKVPFRLEVEEAGDFLTVMLVGAGETDLDLRLQFFDERGQLIHDLASTSPGPYEIVSLPMAEPGLYTVQVESLGDVSGFTLITRLEEPRQLTRATLDVVNNTDFDMCHIYVTPTDQADNPVEQLAEDQVLAAGETLVLDLRAGRYDLVAIDCEDNVISELLDTFLQQDMVWTIGQ
jgi:hypothetical protein